MSITTVAGPRSTAPGIITQLWVDERWVYWAQVTVGSAEQEILRAPSRGGACEKLASTSTVAGFVADERSLYFLDGVDLVDLSLEGGERRTIASFPSPPEDLALGADRLWLLDGCSRRLVSCSKDGSGRVDEHDRLERIAKMVTSGDELFLLHTGGGGSLVRLRIGAPGGRVTLRGCGGMGDEFARAIDVIDQTRELTDETAQRLLSSASVTSLAVDEASVYWTSITIAGESQLRRTPRSFTSFSKAERVPVRGLGLGAHNLATFRDHLYLVDAEGIIKVSKTGGEAERVGPIVHSLAAGPSGVFAGALDGSVLRLEASDSIGSLMN